MIHRTMPRPILLLIALCVLCFWTVRAPLAAPRVVASIKPVHALVAGVMAGVGTPDLLVAGAGSPHTYTLKPSDAAHLDQANVVFWIGPPFENFLVGPMASLASKATVVALIDTPDLQLHPARNAGAWESQPRADEAPSNGNAPGDVDGHIWLDPVNAKAMVAAITRTLVNIDPANAARYSMNAADLATRLDSLNNEISRTLGTVRTKPFVVFHDAYQYFQARYGVNAVGAITVSPDRLPGARRIAGVREKIVSLGAVCVFAEPQFEPKLVRTLVEGTQARIGVLDPEGTTAESGQELYFTLMRNLANNMAACLGP